jgi:chorismate mutase
MAKSDTELKKLRQVIDRADRALIQALGQRLQAVEKIGRIKRRLKLPLYQRARWNEVVEDRVKRGRAKRLDEAFMRKLLALIHRESIRIQKNKK